MLFANDTYISSKTTICITLAINPKSLGLCTRNGFNGNMVGCRVD